MELAGRTAIVTGASRGIGAAIAKTLAANNMNVVCAARSESALRETVEAITDAGGTALAVPTDVTSRRDVRTLVEATLQEYKQIDVLFNNAGRFNAIGGLWEVDPEEWFTDVTVNLRGPMLCCQAVLPHMMRRDEGLIINMNGGGSTRPLAGGSGYGCSKAALLRLTDTLAAELAQEGSSVMVVALGPGFVRTEMTEKQLSEAGRKWIPGSADALDAGKDRPPEDCAKTTVELIRHLRPEFSGRIFSTGQDIAALAGRGEQLVEQDALTLRMRPLEE